MSSHMRQIERLGQTRMATEATEMALDRLRAAVVHFNLAARLGPVSTVERWIRAIEEEKARW